MHALVRVCATRGDDLNAKNSIHCAMRAEDWYDRNFCFRKKVCIFAIELNSVRVLSDDNALRQNCVYKQKPVLHQVFPSKPD